MTDFIQVRRDDAEWFLHARYYARTQKDEQAVKALSERLDRLSAALSAESDHIPDAGKMVPTGVKNAQVAAEPAGLEWREGYLTFNGQEIGQVFACLVGDPVEIGGWTYRFLSKKFAAPTEAGARAALESAARSWLSPIPVSGEKLRDNSFDERTRMAKEILINAHTNPAVREQIRSGQKQEIFIGAVMDALRQALKDTSK